MIPHSRPSLDQAEEQAAVRVIRSGMLAQGKEVAALEQNLATRLGVGHVIAVSSGSAALHLALLTLQLQPNAKVLLPSYVCTALLNAIRLVEASPVIGDIAPNTFQLAPNNIHDNIQAVLTPHMFGQTVDLNAFDKPNIPVIEDCALSLGATYQGKPVGSMGKLSVFSFYATKVICGGEGGAIATRDVSLAECIRDLRDYDGRTDGCLRYNYKMTDLQAALINAQLSKLDAFLSRRRELGARYTNALQNTDATLPPFKDGEFPFRYVIRHPKPADEIIAAFESQGISVRKPVFYPLHRQIHLPDESYPQTTLAYDHAVSLPLYPDLSDHEVDQILTTAQEIL